MESPNLPQEDNATSVDDTLHDERHEPRRRTPLPPSVHAIRLVLMLLTLATTAGGVWLYMQVIAPAGVNAFEIVALLLFTVLFAWIAFSFWTATGGLFGLLLSSRQRRSRHVEPDADAPALPPTAVLMPVYNESPADVFSRLAAIIESLRATGQAAAFEFFVLSDSTNPDAWLEEEAAWAELSAHLPADAPEVYYRHRPENTSRKAGNICDFLTRWGANYENMIVLDADSLMEGATMVEMARRMQADPAIGILQVPPTPVGNTSPFARWQQFCAQFYGPVFVQGLKNWVGHESNYWGHNAIIRIEAFTKHCNLPVLPGQAPLGGEILSHDFVEAALISKAGYKVVLADDLAGSYEACPPSLLDFAIRDQRWCQGNMQHVTMMLCTRLRAVSYAHLGMGAMSYVAAPLWVAFLLVTLMGHGWERWTAGEAAAEEAIATQPALLTFGISMMLLLAPKLWAVLSMIGRPKLRSQFGGWLKIITSVLLETMMSVLITPVITFFHARFVVGVLLGTSVKWNSQNRDEGATPLSTALRAYAPHTLTGVVLTALIVWLFPALTGWFLLVTAGLILSAPVAVAVSHPALGHWLSRRNLLQIPQEVDPPALLENHRQFEAEFSNALPADRETLFDQVIYDPDFNRLHRSILMATNASAALSQEERDEMSHAIRSQRSTGLSPAQRRSILHDHDLMRELHIQSRVDRTTHAYS